MKQVLVFEQGALRGDPGMPHIIVKPGSRPPRIVGQFVFADVGSIVAMNLNAADAGEHAVVEVLPGKPFPKLMELV